MQGMKNLPAFLMSCSVKHVHRSMKRGWTVRVGAQCRGERVAGFLDRSSLFERDKRVTGG